MRKRRRHRATLKSGGSKQDLFAALEVAAEVGDDFPDGAFWAHMESTVEVFNHDHGTNFDPNTSVHEYLESLEH